MLAKVLMWAFRLAGGSMLLLLAACATPAPPVQRAEVPQPRVVPKPAIAPELAPPGAMTSLVCGPTARKIPFAALGIAPYTQLFDIALTPERIWLLVDSNRLVEVSRDPVSPTYRTVTGKEDASWGAIDLDPRDGSLWAVSILRLELIHLIPDGRSVVVSIPRLEGEGGFRDVLVQDDAIWVVPTCAEDALWKLDRNGKVLERAFHRESGEPLTLRKEFTAEEGRGSLLGCQPVSLGRDLQGRLTVFDGVSRTFYRQENGTWTPLVKIPELPAEASAEPIPAGGVRVDYPGTDQAIWAPGSGPSGETLRFFFLDGEPVFQPVLDYRREDKTMFLRYRHPTAEGLRETYETCKGTSFLYSTLVATDLNGFVSATANDLVLGTFQN